MGGVRGLALVLVASDEEACARFAGRTLADRSVALASSVGLLPVAFSPSAVADGPAGRDGAGSHGRPAPGILRPGAPLPCDLDPGRPVAAWRCDAAFVAGLLREVLAEGAPSERVVRDDVGRVAIVRCEVRSLAGRVPASLDGLAASLAAPSLAPPRGTPIAIGAGAPAGRTTQAAEADLVAALENPRDGLFDRLLNRRISRRLTPLLLDLPVTPNQVTLLSLALGLAAAAAFASPGWAWPVAGALLVQATAVLDCVDGEIARAKVLESDRGEILDVTSDTAIHVLAFLGIAVHAGPGLGAHRARVLAALFATGGLLSFLVVTRAERTEERWKTVGSRPARLLGSMLATLTTRDLSVLLLVAALLGLLRPLLVGAAFGAHVFWALALALHSRAMREAAGAPAAREDRQARSVTR